MSSSEIVVGLDDSPTAQAALRWAADYARSTGSPLRAIQVLDWTSEQPGLPVVADHVFASATEIDELDRIAVTRMFEAIQPEPDWRLQFAQGHAGRVLTDQAADAQLLVLGAREHRGVARLISGSVGHYCLSHAVCPVVSVPVPTEIEKAVRMAAASAERG